MQCNREALLLVGDVLYVVQYYRRGDCIVIDKVHLINLVLSYLIKGNLTASSVRISLVKILFKKLRVPFVCQKSWLLFVSCQVCDVMTTGFMPTSLCIHELVNLQASGYLILA